MSKYTFTAEKAREINKDVKSGMTRGHVNDLIIAACKTKKSTSIQLTKPLSADVANSLTQDGFVISKDNRVSWKEIPVKTLT